MKRYILTGAPGAGKTAILRQLERDGYGVIEEAATDARRAEVTEQALRPFCGPWRGPPVGVERYDIWRTLTLIDVSHRLQQVRSIRRVVAEILPRGVLERCIRVNMANPKPDAPAELNKEDILLLQQIISSQTGSSVIYVGSTQLFQDINPTRRRHYVRCDFRRSNDEKLLHIFVKFGVTSRLWDQLESLHIFLSQLDIDEFRVPSYFGCLNAGDSDPLRIAGVWEYVANGASADRRWNGPKSREKIVLAAAAMTAVTEDVRREVPKLRPVASFFHPLAETVDEAMTRFGRRGVDLQPLRGKVAQLAAFEPGALERLGSLGAYLTHNDYQTGNVSLNDGERPVIFDWDSASYGPPGATLRAMARLPEGALAHVVTLYCSHLEAKGWSFRKQDVTFAIRATSVFHALAFGARISDRINNLHEGRLKWGLKNLRFLET